MLEELIQRVIKTHPDFTYEEIHQYCIDYIESITEKMKEETKIKRLTKHLEKEFELESSKYQDISEKIYNLDGIPEYLFNGKTEIVSSLIEIK
jgi:hypothetical protein